MLDRKWFLTRAGVFKIKVVFIFKDLHINKNKKIKYSLHLFNYYFILNGEQNG